MHVPAWHDRRRFLAESGAGLGGIALAWLAMHNRSVRNAQA